LNGAQRLNVLNVLNTFFRPSRSTNTITLFISFPTHAARLVPHAFFYLELLNIEPLNRRQALNDLNRSGAVVWGKLKYDQVFCAR
jgi:hypothetical protein